MEYDSALTNELRTAVIHSRSVYSQMRLADLGYIPEGKSKNPRGLNEVSLSLARMVSLYSLSHGWSTSSIPTSRATILRRLR